MLQTTAIYLLKVIIISGLLLLYYIVALRNKRFHYYNRFYLLFSVAISTVLPLLHLQWFSFSSNSSQAIKFYNLMYSSNAEDADAAGASSLNMQNILLLSLGLLTIVLLATLIIKTIRLYQLKKQYPVQTMQDFDFITTNLEQAPFSFLKNIFWRSDINLDETTGRQILQHEITHVQQKHSYDKLLMQTIMCFFWMNPFFWLLRKELYLIHEFIADEKSVNENDTSAFAEMLLAAQFGKFKFLPAQSLYYSSIKRRLIMLTQSKNSKFSYLRRLFVLPLLVFVVGMFAFTIKNHEADNAILKANAPFTLIVNAGHGGTDNGAVVNDLSEKDFALKIAKKIKDLSNQYGINVIMTREDDSYMSPKGITDFTSKHTANAFVSVHANNADDKDSSGMEVYISRKDKQYIDNSRLLASAVLQNISKDFTANQNLVQRQVGIWVLDHNTMPSVLIECGYMSNAADLQMLQNDDKITLIAKNILQGVAAYANNKTAINDIKLPAKKAFFPNDSATVEAENITINVDQEVQPLYILDGKEINNEIFKKIDPNTIESVSVWKDESAKTKYGDKGKNGVIEIILKKNAGKPATDTSSFSAPWNKVLANTFKSKDKC